MVHAASPSTPGRRLGRRPRRLRAQVFSEQGTPLWVLPHHRRAAAGRRVQRTALALPSMLGDMYVTDTYNYRIEEFTPRRGEQWR